MKKIEQFYITELTLAGFKNYLEPTTFVFGNPTVITGGNGQGKSTLADAVAFAVTGLPFFGERGIDRLYNDAMKQQMELSVRLRFVDQDGAAHELYRLRKNSRMVITYDGYDIRQTDLTDMFGERDVFLSIFNPLYFIEVLEDDGKNLLERYLPVIPHETVLSQLSEHVQESLKDEEILSPEVYLKRKREQIRELEEQIIYLTGQKDLTCLQGRESSKASASLNEQLQSLQEEAGHLEQKRFSGLEPKEMERQLVELSRQYDETSRDLRSAERFSEIDGQISELTQKVAARQAESYQSKFLQPLADISARVSELGRRYKQELHNFQSFAPGVCCPTCHRPITEAALEEVRAETEKFVQALIAQGKEQQAQFAELKALDQQAAETFVQFKQDDLRAWSEELERLRSQRRELEEDRRGEEQLETLREQIQELTSALEYGNLTQAGYDRLKECKEEIRELEAKIEANQTMGEMQNVGFLHGLNDIGLDAETERQMLAPFDKLPRKFLGSSANVSFWFTMDGLHRYLPAIQMLEKEIEPVGWNLLCATMDISKNELTVAKYQDSEQIAFPKEFVRTQPIEFQEISDFSERL